MKKLKLLWSILKTTGVNKIVTGFIAFIFCVAFGILIIEPGITNYGDALWFTFVSFTTIGYGDLYAVTFLGRILTAFLTVYGVLVIALIPGVLVSYFTEITSLKQDETISMFLDKLENLPSLSKEELTEMSNNIKKRRYK